MKRWTRLPVWAGLATLVAGSVAGGVMMMAPSGTAAAGGSADRSSADRSSTGRSSTGECTHADLSAKYKGGDAATSHVYGRIILRNVSDTSCWVRGYGGLSYVGGGNGTQVGAPADRTPGNTPRTVLEPGEKVRSAVSETSFAPYPRRLCQPMKVDGFRVYAPDQTHSFFIEHPTTGCANTEVHLLSHKAYH